MTPAAPPAPLPAPTTSDDPHAMPTVAMAALAPADPHAAPTLFGTQVSPLAAPPPPSPALAAPPVTASPAVAPPVAARPPQRTTPPPIPRGGARTTGTPAPSSDPSTPPPSAPPRPSTPAPMMPASIAAVLDRAATDPPAAAPAMPTSVAYALAAAASIDPAADTLANVPSPFAKELRAKLETPAPQPWAPLASPPAEAVARAPAPSAAPTSAPEPSPVKAVWKTAHPSARRWVERRADVGRRAPNPARIALGLFLIGLGAWFLVSFLPGHRPITAAERAVIARQAGVDEHVWRYAPTPYGVARGLAVLLITAGGLAAVRGATFRRRLSVACPHCRAAAPADREGLVLRCTQGRHRAGWNASAIALLVGVGGVGVALAIVTLLATLRPA
jgi:hypothetical protein